MASCKVITKPEAIAIFLEESPALEGIIPAVEKVAMLESDLKRNHCEILLRHGNKIVRHDDTLYYYTYGWRD